MPPLTCTNRIAWHDQDTIRDLVLARGDLAAGNTHNMLTKHINFRMVNQRFASIGLVFLLHLAPGVRGQEEVSNLCPATLPVEGEACTPFPVFESCSYGNFCCPGGDDPQTCVPETECYCDSTYKTWQCLEPRITCPSVCPEDRPIGGRVECDIQDRYICEYDIGPSCPREGDAPDAACSCLSGHFSCYNDCDDDSVTADEGDSDDDSVPEGGSDDDSVTEGGSDDDSVTEDDSVPDDDVSDSGEDGDSESGGVLDTSHVGEANGDGNNSASKNGDKPKKDRGGKMNSKTGARGHKKGEKRNLRRVVH